MDYEKKYKNALEWARRVINGEVGFVRNEVEEEIFPELKESEDEKIRKALIKGVECCKESGWTNFSNNVDIDVVLAWLKEQGKQKPIDYNKELKKCRENPLYFFDKYVKLEKQKPACSEEDERVKKRILLSLEKDLMATKNSGCDTQDLEQCIAWLEKQCYTKKDVDDAYLKGISDAKNELEKQGEQKPFDYESANIQQKDFAPINVTDEGIVEAIKNTSVLDMIEQKPAWSEEDEKMANDLIEGFQSQVKVYNLVHTSKEIADWLKSLKNRVQPQVKEWSEEDKEYLAACIDVIDNFYTLSGELKTLTKINVFKREYAEKLKFWLKSLKDRIGG